MWRVKNKVFELMSIIKKTNKSYTLSYFYFDTNVKKECLVCPKPNQEVEVVC